MAGDYLMRQIEDITRVLATYVLQQKHYRHEEIAQSQQTQTMFLFYRLQRLISENMLEEAEQLLLETLAQDASDENLNVALDFYEDLQALSEEQLAAGNYSREKIVKGLQAIQELYHI
ncbi:MAG: DUF6483 family protein [Oscillospiraceae bacterium]